MREKVGSTCGTCFGIMGMLRRAFQRLPLHTRKTLTQALVVSRLDYGNALMLAANESLIKTTGGTENCGSVCPQAPSLHSLRPHSQVTALASYQETSHFQAEHGPQIPYQVKIWHISKHISSPTCSPEICDPRINCCFAYTAFAQPDMAADPLPILAHITGTVFLYTFLRALILFG